MRLKSWQVLLGLALTLLLVYSPTLFAGFCTIDDDDLIHRLSNAPPLDFFSLFFPKTSIYYYRPISILTYHFDRAVWGLNPGPMHVENILLHLGCAFFVYLLSRRISSTSLQTIPLAGCFLFALHPLCCEPVCWISGRTDLLSGFFLLLALWHLVNGLEQERRGSYFLCGASFLLACLSKEVALFAVPGFLWLIIYWNRAHTFHAPPRQNSTLPIRIILLTAAIYLVMRQIASKQNDKGMAASAIGVIGETGFHLTEKLRTTLEVYGFYFKKFFIPWPLNFGITEISGWYLLVGFLALILLLRNTFEKNPATALILTSCCLLLSALLVAYGKIAWTPYAERYLYVPMAVVFPAVAFRLERWQIRSETTRTKLLHLGFTILLLIFFGTSLHRAWLWQDNARLYADTIRNNPNFFAVYTELASVLNERDEKISVPELYARFRKEGSTADSLEADLKYALYLIPNQPETARAFLLDRLAIDTVTGQQRVLDALIKANDMRIALVSEGGEREMIRRENLDWLWKLYQLDADPYTLFRIGKLHLALNEKAEALKSFRNAIAQSSTDTVFYDSAVIYIRLLTQQETN